MSAVCEVRGEGRLLALFGGLWYCRDERACAARYIALGEALAAVGYLR